MIHRILSKICKIITPKYGNYALLVWKNRLRNSFLKDKEHKYLFILSPPYCGSTLLNQLISTSKSVSVNNQVNTREGQRVPTLSKLMFDHTRRWDSTLDYDWRFVNKEWLKYWDLKAAILLEKSPPNIVRAKSIEKYFQPAFFLIFYRNPYAHCESLIRRNNKDPAKAAEFAIQCLNYQKINILELKSQKLQVSYELLTEQTESTVKMMTDLLPELSDMNYEKEFTAKNSHSKEMKISNLNQEKIDNLTLKEREAINSVFIKNIDTLNFFGYQLIQSTKNHY
ncbi:MAG: sulfotransferase [Psychroserpens sp.]|uniref:sulfotransferase n=1 Tax=Psychroserpens sp. TaxID=2020870 RepID=UPI003002A9CD